MMSKQAFVLNDYTVDLIADDGVLSCAPGAQQIEAAICAYLDRFAANGDFIAVCLDTHTLNDPYHPETALFPPHNLKGEPGNRLYGQVAEKVAALQQSHPAQITVIEKNRFSAFAGTKLDLWLRSRGVDHITVSGVCTDMCVLHTVIEAYSRGYRITVPQSVCYTPNQAGSDFAFAHFREALGLETPD